MSHPDLLVVITQAEKGASLVKNNTAVSVLTKPIPFSQIMNPVGSGDIFSANLCMALKQNLNDPMLSVDIANKKTGAYLIKTT